MGRNDRGGALAVGALEGVRYLIFGNRESGRKRESFSQGPETIVCAVLREFIRITPVDCCIDRAVEVPR